MNTLPDGWTDDMRVAIDPARIDDLFEFIFDGHVCFANWDEMSLKIMQDFGLSEDDAILAIDRVQGGMVRAVTGNPVNRPDPIKDPLAHMSFERIWSELPRVHIFSRRRNPYGKWADWSYALRNRNQE